MGPVLRQGLLIVGLILLSLLLAWSGVLQTVAPWLAPPRVWRADRTAEASTTADRLTVQRELLIRLNAENAELRRRLGEYAEIGESGQVHPNRSVLRRARVVARSDRASRHHIVIDAGVYHGARVDMAVAVGWSLVGVIVGERPGESLVRLVTDAESRVPAHLVDLAEPDPFAGTDDGADTGECEGEGEASPVETGSDLGSPTDPRVVALGVVAGTGDRDRLELRFVEDRPDLRPEVGMGVITAGGPGAVPPGLVLGEVVAAELSPESDHWSIAVEPTRHAGAVASVLVLRAPETAVPAE